MASLLFEHPVWKGQPICLISTLGQILEEVSDHTCLRISTFIQYDVEELPELNHARAVLVDKGDQVLDFFYRVDEPKADKGALDLVDSNRPRSVVIQTIEALFELSNLTMNKNKFEKLDEGCHHDWNKTAQTEHRKEDAIMPSKNS